MNTKPTFFSIENRTKYFPLVLLFLCLVSIIIFYIEIKKDIRKEVIKNEQKKIADNPFNRVRISARSAYVYDVVNKREIYSKNADEVLPLASLTKVLTAVTAEENFKNNQNNDEVKITQENLRAEGDSKLIPGDKWSVKNLTDFILVTSSNDGALALASAINYNTTINQGVEKDFIYMMNRTAEKIGMSGSKFYNEHGLDIDGMAGALGSSKDMAKLFEYTIKNYPNLMEATKYKDLQISSDIKSYTAENTNAFVDKIPGLLASKTGFTDLAGGNLVIAFDPGLNRPIIISVLGSTQEERFTDILELTSTTLAFLKQNDNN